MPKSEILKKRIGKPQKTKKHKKIKATAFYDPDAFLIANKPRGAKSDQAPSGKDDNFVSAATRRVMEFQNAAQQGKLPDPPSKKPDDKKLPKKRPGESHKKFVNRLQRDATIAIAKSKFESKYEVQIEGMKNGDIKYKKLEKKSKKNKRRLNELKERKKDIKEAKKADKEMDFKQFKDEVEFGDVAMAPPSLSAKPRKADGNNDRPGKKSLLLKEIMETNQRQNPMAFVRTDVGKNTKKKQLSLSKQKMLHDERERVIAHYRQLKEQKMKS